MMRLGRETCYFSVNENSMRVTKDKSKILTLKENRKSRYSPKPQDYNGVAKITRVEPSINVS